MIPIIYDSTENAFISNGLGRLRDCISCVVTEERNGIFECDFTYPVDGANFDLIQPGRIIAVTHDDLGDIQPFDIVSYTKPIDGIVAFHAVHVSYRQSEMTVEGKNINSLAAAFNLFATATPTNPFNYTANFTSSAYMAAADGTPRTVRQMLGGVEGSILDTYGGEYRFDKWDVALMRSRGVDRDFTIRYGVNLLDYNEENEYQQVYNACIPFWKGTNDSGEETVIKGSMVSNGQPLYNGRTICVPLDLTEKFESVPTKAEVENMARLVMTNGQVEQPKQTITVDFIRLQDSEEYAGYADLLQCNLCDTIKVVFPEYNMQGRFKIVKTTYDVLMEKYTEMELGTLSTTLAEALGISNTLDRSGGGGGGSTFENLSVNNNLTVGNDATIDGNLTIEGHTSPVGTALTTFTRSGVTRVGTTVVTLANIDLPAGTWIVKGWVRFGAGTSGYRRMWVTSSSTITSTQTGACTATDSALQITSNNVGTFKVTETTRIYIRAQASATVDVAEADCGLSAVRIA